MNLTFAENGTVQFETAFSGREETIKKEIANCTPRVLISTMETGAPRGKEFAISIPNIQKELGIVKKGSFHQTAHEEDPVMILKSYPGKSGEERRVIVVDLKDNNGATIVVPLEIKSTKNQSYEINRMISVYGKNDRETKTPKYEWFDNQLNAGNLLYANRKKAIDEILRRSPTWPIPEEEVDNLFSTPNVANEEDLVKFRERESGVLPGSARRRPCRHAQHSVSC